MENKNEVKRTPGEWYIDNKQPYVISIHSKWNNENPVEKSATFGDYRGSYICSMEWNTGVPTKEQAEANAAFICEAVNNYDKLKEDNAILLDALENLPEYLNEAANSLEIQANQKGCTNALSPTLKWYALKIENILQKAESK